MNSDEQMRETVRRARELMTFVSPDPDQWSEHNREIAAALCNEELPALCNDNDTLRAELASVTAERDALRAIVERTRKVVRNTDHMEDCPADHSCCGPAPEGWWDCAGGRTEEECRAYTVEGCNCGVGPLRLALGMEVTHG